RVKHRQVGVEITRDGLAVLRGLVPRASPVLCDLSGRLEHDGSLLVHGRDTSTTVRTGLRALGVRGIEQRDERLVAGPAFFTEQVIGGRSARGGFWRG